MDNKDCTFETLRPTNEFRPADWRWKRAMLYIDKGTSTRTHDDKMVLQVVQYLRLVRAGESSEELANKYPDLYEVDRIYSDSKDTRWLIEALIMAGCEPEYIAEYFGFSDSNFIKLYELLKFDVRSRLKFKGFITGSILDALDSGSLPPAKEKIWKALAWVGYKNGHGDRLLQGFIDIDAMPADIKAWYDTFIQHHFSRKVVSAVFKGNPLKNPLLMDAIRTVHEGRKLEMEEHKLLGDSAGTDVQESQKALIGSLNMIIATVKPGLSMPSIEARASEQLQLEIGNAIKLERQQIQSEVVNGKDE